MASTRTKRLARRAGVLAVAMGALLSLGGSAFAAVPLTQVSQDPYTNTSSFHQTQLEPDTFSFGSTIVAAFQTGRFNNGGASNICWATSTNSGQSWTNGCLPGTTIYATPAGTYARISDPSVAYDAKDNVWMISGLAINSSVTGKAVLISRSIDGGLTWQNPVTVSVAGGSSFYDKEWVACDDTAASAFYGNCYVEWDDAALGDQLKMSRSVDGGQNWTSSSVPNKSVIGGQPLVQPGGTVIMPIGGGAGIEAFRSTNGGASYTGPFAIASVNLHGPGGGLRNGGGLPSAEVDGAGKVYVAWYDCRFRTGCAENDIVYSTSTDGMTWTSPVRIPIDATTSTVDHFIPGIAVDRTTSGSSAHIGVTYYFYPNASCGTSSCKLSAGFISSTNGGATWGAPKTLFKGVSLKWLPLTNQGYMVGDYISTSFSNGKAYPVIARATFTGTNCTAGQITSCSEFMVAPTNGLAALGGARVAGLDRPVASAPFVVRGIRTAF